MLMLSFRFLFSDDGERASIGRVTMWLFTIAILYRFIFFGNDIPVNVVYVYYALVMYNLFKKPMPAINQFLANYNKGKPNV